jgi:tRNA A37 N6-isopentenylltransferase MiaA
MYLYIGLDIASARVTPSEQKGIPHHLLGCVDPFISEPVTVRQYQQMAVDFVADIRRRGGVPIVTGGTHYYLEGLIFGDATETHAAIEPLTASPYVQLTGSAATSTNATATATTSAAWPQTTPTILISEPQRSHLSALIDAIAQKDVDVSTGDRADVSRAIESSESVTNANMASSFTIHSCEVAVKELYQFLRDNDPESAALIHPKNTRKVIKAVEFMLQNVRGNQTIHLHDLLLKLRLIYAIVLVGTYSYLGGEAERAP